MSDDDLKAELERLRNENATGASLFLPLRSVTGQCRSTFIKPQREFLAAA